MKKATKSDLGTTNISYFKSSNKVSRIRKSWKKRMRVKRRL